MNNENEILSYDIGKPENEYIELYNTINQIYNNYGLIKKIKGKYSIE